MNLNILKPRQALNKAYLKVKTSRNSIDTFKSNLIQLIDNIKESESEEFHKNLVSDFLKNTWYGTTHFINTKGRNDLVIHNTNSASGTVGVIIEAKSPVNKNEMLKPDNVNTKAFHELVLYYLRERITHKNLEIKHLIATNIYEWYIFDANTFEKEFAQNKALVKQFVDFEEGRLAGKTTDFFYKEIAQPAINTIKHELTFTRFDIRDYNKPLRNADKADDTTLIALYKLLAPENLLKLPFANDSNSLDKTFYSELLHIIGLTEIKDGGKKLIQRKKEGERDTASLLENTITQLDSHDKISRLSQPSQYGDNYQERLFNVALELVITWMNRVLFLKLLEAQLISYHKGDKQYAFLNSDKLKDFDDLDKLFFRVLARKVSDRDPAINQLFGLVPYLNSSLFEPTELEHQTIFISGLEDFLPLPFISATVIKDANGKKSTTALNTLQYLFEFLNAYDFSSEGSEEIRDDNKSLINASVLGLIFEKINGYKDGSFFTPGFITMYMCRETIRRAVVQKFNDTKNWNCENLEQLYDKIDNREEANTIINSLKICDPAVGSGHFLVSALNEIIAIKSELKVLTDRSGKRLKEYNITVENDELIITDDDGQLFVYNPRNTESQRIQETLFHEKQTIIENALFGVDLNPNSVKICRLRLWIELLKNAYYKAPDFAELETLPNIDINIKCGNSLISRYSLDTNLKKALSSGKWNIDSYRIAVHTYKNAQNKEQKHEMLKLINDIKSNFRSHISQNDSLFKNLNKKKSELLTMTEHPKLFELAASDKKAWNKKVKELTDETNKLESKIEEIKSNRIYENAFEWRFEFPEVLNDDGDFIGFDTIIGNPPYGVNFSENEKNYYKQAFDNIHTRTPESFNYFWGLTTHISKKGGFCNFIIPSSFISQIEFEKTRKLLIEKHSIYLIINLGDGIFDDVATPTCIIGYQKCKDELSINYHDLTRLSRVSVSSELGNMDDNIINSSHLSSNSSFTLVYKPYKTIIDKCYRFPLLKEIAEDVATGVSPGLGEAFVIDKNTAKEFDLEFEIIKNLVTGTEINRYNLKPSLNKQLIYCTSNTVLPNYPNIENYLSKFKLKLEQRVETINGSIPWFVMLRPRRQKLFENSKILIRQTANKIIAAYDDDKWYCLKSGLIIQLPEQSTLSYFYLLGLLNSKLFDFLYHDLVNEDNRIFPEVKPIQLFKLPICVENIDKQIEIEKKVLEIIKLKREELDTTILESQINQLVYQLYGLTSEEIKIVEAE